MRLYLNKSARQLIILLITIAVMALTASAQAEKVTAQESYNLGVKAMQEGNLPNAEIAFKAAIQLDANYADAYLNLGVVYFELKDFDKALGMFKDATAKDPQNYDAFANLGRVQSVLKKNVEAIESFKSAIALNNTAGELYRELGDVYYGNQSYADVIEAMKKCHELGAGDYRSHYTLGKSLQKQSKTAEAIAEFEQSVKLKPYYYAYAALGQIYLGKEEYKLAADAFKSAEKADPKQAHQAAFNYAVAIENSNPDATEANITNWERYIKLAKNNPKAKKNLAVAQAHVKELKEKK